MSTVSAASRMLTLRDGVRLEIVESAGDAPYREMDPRFRGDDGLEIPSSPRKRGSIPILLLHGFTGAASTWRELLPSFGERRRAISVSLPGHGGSDAPEDPSRYAASRVAEDVLELLDLLEIRRVALLGYSMGARVALHTALAAPDRVGALIIESGSPGIAGGAERAERRAADEALAADIERDGLEAFVDRWERLPLWSSQRQLSSAAREGLRAQRLAGSVRGLANSLRGIGAGATAPLHERLCELAGVPVLLVCGALDEKYVRLARERKELFPRATLRVVEGAGHAVHLERPRELLGAVEDFLMELESAASPYAVSWNGSPLSRG